MEGNEMFCTTLTLYFLLLLTPDHVLVGRISRVESESG